MKVCILSSVHPPFDARIFHKQAKSLVKAGYDVTLIAQHEKDEVVDGIKIIALPRPKNRLRRMLGTTWKAFNRARKQKAGIYHFHDPELLPIGLLLKVFTRGKVIYDIHEDVRGDLTTKLWLPRVARWSLSLMYWLLERLSLPFIDEIIIAEDSYIKNYKNRQNILAIRNYPILSLLKETADVKNSRPTIVYAGRIAEARGVFELIEAVRLLKPSYENLSLTLVGQVSPDTLVGKIGNLLERLGLQDNVSLVGGVKHEEIYNIMPRCHIGIAILYPEPNYIESLPTKLFEYMAAGLPVIASNFPLWKEIVEGNNCGLTVNPLDPEDIARAIEYLIEHPEEARKMGKNGRKAVKEKYNWEAESQKLIELYKNLTKGKRTKQ
jgi:glycosyltransferase involved in cell wall biosynthesis